MPLTTFTPGGVAKASEVNANFAQCALTGTPGDFASVEIGGTEVINSSRQLVNLGIAINEQSGTSYTLALADALNAVRLTNGSAIELTIPLNATVAFPIGTGILVIAGGTGVVTFVPESGSVTIRSFNNLLDLAGKDAMALALKTGTNEWTVGGVLL